MMDKENIRSLFLDSSMVEHSAVNRRVVGSSPTRGVKSPAGTDTAKRQEIRLLGQVVKTPPFHGGNMGSNPVGVIYHRAPWPSGKAKVCNTSITSSILVGAFRKASV